MAEFKQRIPILSDIVSDGEDDPCRERVPASKTLDVLVDSLYRDFMDNVQRSMQELLNREEARLRTAIRAHLEVMLPEIMEQWQKECAKARKQDPAELTAYGRDYPGALEPMVAGPPRPAKKPRR